MRPMLFLSVREITSVSATFILSSRLDSPIDPLLSSLGITEPSQSHENHQITPRGHKSNDGEATDAIANASATLKSGKTDSHSRESPRSTSPTDFLIADALSNGFSVTVNGSAWPRTFIRIDEQIDEAVIIVYALMPGRQYDIELGLAASQTEQQQTQHQEQDVKTRTLRRQIVTQENDPNSPVFDNDSTPSSSSSSSSPLSTPSSSTRPSSASFITPPPPQHPTTPPPQPTITERLTQLHQSLTHLTTERDTLLTSLKSLRRESQKAEASLRAEIDMLKRTFDKNASFELRSRQKLLALQESVKRAQNAARESEEMTREVEREISELMKKKEEKENEHGRMEDEAGKARRERREVEEEERKRIEGMRGELSGLTNKLERLNGKRERIEELVIPDLEAKVQDIEGEIEDAEREVAQLEKDEQTRLQFEEPYLSYHQTPLWAPPPLRAAPTRPALHTRSHNPRSHSMHSTPVIHPPHRQPSLKTKSMSMNTGSSTAIQPTSLFLMDQPQHLSPISPSTRSSPGASGSVIKGSTKLSIPPPYSPGAGGGHTSIVTSPSSTVNVPDPLAVGAGRPSRRSLEATIRAGKTVE